MRSRYAAAPRRLPPAPAPANARCRLPRSGRTAAAGRRDRFRHRHDRAPPPRSTTLGPAAPRATRRRYRRLPAQPTAPRVRCAPSRRQTRNRRPYSAHRAHRRGWQRRSLAAVRRAADRATARAYRATMASVRVAAGCVRRSPLPRQPVRVGMTGRARMPDRRPADRAAARGRTRRAWRPAPACPAATNATRPKPVPAARNRSCACRPADHRRRSQPQQHRNQQ